MGRPSNESSAASGQNIASTSAARTPRGVVVVGASAGGVEALRSLVAQFPADLQATVLVVLHIPRQSPSALGHILSRAGILPAADARDGQPLRPGRIFIAPADHHLLVLDGRLHLSRGPTENGHRPAVDPLFRSAARAYGQRVIGVVLSGARDDGTAGLAAVAEHGGVALVQDPGDALHPSMPRTALEHVPAARPLTAEALGREIYRLVAEMPATAPAEASNDDLLLTAETAMANMEDVTTDQLGAARPSGLACPTCNGGLFELPGEPRPRYRCRIGHAWSPESLLDEQAETLEGALWMALRSLEEKVALSRSMAESARRKGIPGAAKRYEAMAGEARQSSMLIRNLILRLGAVEEKNESSERWGEEDEMAPQESAGALGAHLAVPTRTDGESA